MIENRYMKDTPGQQPYQPLSAFEAIVIKVASPETIRSWSHGEVKNPETLNYRTLKPERGGLFCEKIFGPTRDWECSCGKYKRIKHKDVVCDRCGVEVTLSKVRRERMGHIELAVPVSHIWFFKCMPSRIGLMLDMTAKHLEEIIYYETWVVTDPGDTPLELGQIIEADKYEETKEEYGDSFEADMGAPAIRKLLESIELEPLRAELELKLNSTKNKAERRKLTRRLRLVEGFIASNSRPEWMILEVLPVIPPDLRPLVHLDGGRIATSDLNDLYRRVINRNNRLKNLLQLHTPEIITRNEKRMLQEAVDALLDNGRHGRSVNGAGNRPLKSLSDMLKGKSGRFRQNLLGKRVDYSGRSVIVVGPELSLHQCGLPKKMALTLFSPFIIRHLKERGRAQSVRAATRMIERGEPEVWDILEQVTKGHPVMLNRAPTLHRLSIQAFDPILIEGSAIRLHPLVCTGYNADFDGDQMAVHVPLSAAAQLECKLLMLSTLNIFSPANGKPIATPTQDITLGMYYLTLPPKDEKIVKSFVDIKEVLFAYDSGYLKIHDAVRIPNPDYGVDTPRGDKESRYITTTPGRCIFNSIWDKCLGFWNEKPKYDAKGNRTGGVAVKKTIGKLIAEAYEYIGHARTITLLDNLKNLGYKYATIAGFSISISDMSVPKKKAELIAAALAEVEKQKESRRAGSVTEVELHNKIVDIWTAVSQNVAEELFKESEEAHRKNINPVYSMLDSGARGSKEQIRQLAGMRGLMAKPNGEVIERPILSNFREGLSVLEYFISTHGARKGLADTALKTADSGYMTRKLVDVAQDIICRCEDCGTMKGIWVSAIRDGDKETLSLKDRLIGRFSAQTIRDPVYKDRLIVEQGQEFTPEIADRIEKCGIGRVQIRSVLTCDVEHGVCVKCYGKNLATDRMAEVGDALGIIAAQSIGEPGTQLTMRTFHIGGTASSELNVNEIKAKEAGTILFDGLRTVEAMPEDEKEDDNTAEKTSAKRKRVMRVVNNGTIVIYDSAKAKKLEAEKRKSAEDEARAMGSIANPDYNYWADAVKEAELERFTPVIGAELFKKDGEKVKSGERIASWSLYNMPIITEVDGIVDWVDLLEGVTLNRKKNPSGKEELTVVARGDGYPQILVRQSDDENNVTNYPLPPGTQVRVHKGDRVRAGKVLATIPRQATRNKDITGGLPRVSELFEARTPKEVAEIATIDGEVFIDNRQGRARRVLTVRDSSSGLEKQLLIPATKHLLVSSGDQVKKGQKLTIGSIVPQKLLEVCGAQELQRFLVNEVQAVYRSQNVEINDKHIEIIIRQMM